VADTVDEVSEAAVLEVATEVGISEAAIEVAISEEDVFMAAITGDIRGDSASIGDGPTTILIGDGLIMVAGPIQDGPTLITQTIIQMFLLPDTASRSNSNPLTGTTVRIRRVTTRTFKNVRAVG